MRELKAVAAKKLRPVDKEGWNPSGRIGVNVSQGVSSNWAAGGEQYSIGFNLLINYNINYKNGKNTWDNYIDIGLGFQNATSFGRFRKTNDGMDITTKYGYQLNKNWYSTFLINFNSQLLAGYNYSDSAVPKISNFLSPGKVLFSPGFDCKPDNTFSLFLSPATVRWVIKSDKSFYAISKFGVDSAKTVNTEMGAYLTAKYNRNMTKWASYTGRLDLFSNYNHNPGNIDVIFNNLFILKFNKWLASQISVDLLYDDDILQRTQFKETLGLGLVFKL